MRLDKFLKLSRLVKQRQRAKTICDSNSAFLNGKIVKASSQVKQGDLLEVIIGNRKIAVMILDVPVGNVSKKDASLLFEVKKETILDEEY